MANYIQKEEYHELMINAKRHGAYPPRLISLIYLHCNEVSKLYHFNCHQDKEDAIGLAVADILQYGIKNFKDCPLIQLKFHRNMDPGDQIILRVAGQEYSYTATLTPTTTTEFEIGSTVNKTLDSIVAVMSPPHVEYLELSLHKVTMKMNVMNVSHRTTTPVDMELEVRTKNPGLLKTHPDDTVILMEFEASPPSFNMVTSVIRNAFAKYFNSFHPEPTRNGNKLNFSDINIKDGGIFNI